MMGPIRVVVVDDHPVVVAGARALMDTADDLLCVGDAGTGAAALKLIAESAPDVAVLDVTLPDVSGFQLASRVLQQNPETKIVMMTLLEDSTYAQQALQIGASGFIQKRSASQNFLQAVRSAAMGGIYLDPPSARSVGARSTAEEAADRASAASLTAREQDVLRMVALGYANKEIAWQLQVSIKSVETYKARATEKLELSSRAQIVRYGIMNGWFDLAAADTPFAP